MSAFKSLPESVAHKSRDFEGGFSTQWTVKNSRYNDEQINLRLGTVPMFVIGKLWLFR